MLILFPSAKCRSSLTLLKPVYTTRPISTLGKNCKARTDSCLVSMVNRLDQSIVRYLGLTQTRSFSHLYRRRRSMYSNTALASSAWQLNRELSHPWKWYTFDKTYISRYRRFESTVRNCIGRIVLMVSSRSNTQSVTDDPPRSIFDTMGARSFSHSYRRRRLAPILAYLPDQQRDSSFRRCISSAASSSAREVDHTGRPGRALRSWYLRVLAAGITCVLALRLIDRDVDPLSEPGDDFYREWHLCKVENISAQASIFTLRAASNSLLGRCAPVTSISIKEPNSNIQRPYTILEMDGDVIKILVKRYEGGEISRYIHSRKIDSKVFLKKAPSTYELPSEIPDRFVLISGGTGIATTFQVLKYFATLPVEERPNFKVLYASTDWSEVYLRDEFVELGKDYGDKLEIDYFIDSCGAFIDAQDIKMAYSGKGISSTLVCGSDGFVEHIAGRKPEIGQGEVGGLLAANGIRDNIWKL